MVGHQAYYSGALMALSFRSHLKCGVAFTVALGFFGAASTAQAQTNWSGFYTGIGIGLGQLNSTTDIRDLCTYDGYDCPKEDMNAHGAAVSLYTGFMAPVVGSNFVWGVEGDLNWLGARDENSTTYVDSGYDAVTTNKLDFLGTLRLRAGIARDNTLLYLTGGLAVGTVQNKWSYVNYDSQFKRSITRFGWVVGTGVEHYMTDNVAVRLEGFYGDLGKNSATETNLSGATYNYYPIDTHVRTHNVFGLVRAGISIKW